MRRRVVVALALSAMPLLVVGACTFPDVTFATADGASPTNNSDAPSSSEAGNDAPTTPGDAGSEGGDFLNPDGQAADSATRSDATAPIDPDAGFDACRGPICDCDNDHHRKSGCDAGGANTNNEPFDDCDDLDPLRFPSQGYVADPPPPGQTPAGDWNCDGTVTKGIPDNGWCAGSITCSSATGFNHAIPCGAPATLNECKPNGTLLACIYEFSTTANPNPRPQVCK